MVPTPRSRVLRLSLVGAGGWLVVLGGCDNRPQSAPADPHQPSRPTNVGSLTDALRRSPGRVLRSGGAPAEPAIAFPTPPSPSERLDDATRGVVQEYLVTLTRVGTMLRSVSDPALAEDAVERLAPLVDQWRGAMDYLAMVPESAQGEIRREFGEQLREAARGVEEEISRLGDRPAFAPLVTLVADVPMMSADEPTPVPQAIHAGAAGPAGTPE